MNSDIPKSLHHFSGKTMLARIIENVLPIDPHPTIVIGHRGEEIIHATEGKYSYVEQKEQLGTGHAVACARENLLKEKADHVIVVPSDSPLLSTNTLNLLLDECAISGASVSFAVASLPRFDGPYLGLAKFGRILRGGASDIRGIIEWKDASEEERNIREVNAGFYCFRTDFLLKNIEKLENNNAAKEFYLTDIIAHAIQSGEKVTPVILANPLEGLGVNSQEELETAKKALTMI